MIVLDIETSGLDIGKNGIWQIGAMDLDKPENYFLQEARIDNEDIVMEEALKVIGKTEEELRDKNKQSQKQLIINYLDWKKICKEKLTMGQNVGWDLIFIQNKCLRYGIIDKFREVAGQRGMDLQTIAQEKHKELYGKYLLKENGNSDMSLKKVLEFCGMEDNRGTHNALEDCKLEGECYWRLEYGKNLFPEYSQYKIPKELEK